MSESRDPDVGTLGEEAAKLVDALAGWAREHAGDAGTGVADLAGHATAAARDVGEQLGEQLDEHLATGSGECTVCPVCRAVHTVRQVSPEAWSHLGTAATALGRAVSALFAPPTQDPGAAPSRGEG